MSYRGALWYRESDDVLSISNYETGYAGGIGPQWTEINGGGPGANPDDYLKLTGGTITGPTTFDCPTMVKWDEASANSYPFSVYGGDKWAFRVGDTGVVKIFGTTEMNQPSGTALRIKKDGVDKVKIEHGGRIYCAYDLSLDTDLRTVTTKGWVDSEIKAKGDERYLQLAEGGQITGYVQFKDDTKLQMGGTYNNNIIDGAEGFTDNSIVATLGFVNHQIAQIGDSVGDSQAPGFIDAFNHGYAPIQGSPSAPISKSQVAFLSNSGDATKVMVAIGQVLLPWEFINPAWITGTGVIKIAPEEQPDRINGYLTVYDFFVNEGKNVTLIAEVSKYGPNTSEISYGKRHLLTFNGVFFGVYDPFWNP